MPETLKQTRTELPLRQQMLMVFTLVIFIFSLILAFIIDSNLKNTAVKNYAEKNEQNALFFANMIDNVLEQELLSIQTRADNMNVLGLVQNPDVLQKSLDNLQKSKPNFSWIGYVNLDGKVIASTQGMLQGADVSQRPWFKLGLKKSGAVDVHEALLLAKLLQNDTKQPLRFIDVVAPVKTRDGNITGVLGAHLSVAWLNDQMNFYVSSVLKDSQYRPNVIGTDGKVRFGKDLETDLFQKIYLLQKQTNAETNHFVFKSESEGDLLATFANHRGGEQSGNLGWTSVLTLPLSHIYDSIIATRLWALSGVAMASLVSWLTLWWLLQLAGKPIRFLMREIKQSRNSYEPLTLQSGLPKEFIEIAKSINEFLISIQSREQLLEQAMIDMRDSFTGVTESFPGVLFKLEEINTDQFVFTYISSSSAKYLNLDIAEMPLAIEKIFTRIERSGSDDLLKILKDKTRVDPNIDITLPIKGNDEKIRQIRINGRFRFTSKGMSSWDGVMVNVSDLIEAQQMASEADLAKSKFLATMSHEIRTPLNGILGFAQILLQEVDTPQQKSDVQKIIDTSETLTRILNDILDFSKIEEGKIQLESRPFNLPELVESSASLFHVEAKKRNLDFSVNIQVGHQNPVLGDPTRLRQILTNLLSNALKFTATGGVSLTVMTGTPIDNTSLLKIIVKDTGIGMTSDQLNRLFKRFEQSDETIFRRFGGSGLGLAIVKGLIDAMGGRISVSSIANIGTTFDIELNLPVIESTRANDISQPTPNVRPLKVLVVDDVATNRELLRRFLQKDGHAVKEAENGLEASEIAASEHFDLILMDVDMPICNGIESTKMIRSGDGLSKHSQIIALTGYAFEKDISKVLECGMNAHLAKPISFPKLREQIRIGFPS